MMQILLVSGITLTLVWCVCKAVTTVTKGALKCIVVESGGLYVITCLISLMLIQSVNSWDIPELARGLLEHCEALLLYR